MAWYEAFFGETQAEAEARGIREARQSQHLQESDAQRQAEEDALRQRIDEAHGKVDEPMPDVERPQTIGEQGIGDATGDPEFRW